MSVEGGGCCVVITALFAVLGRIAVFMAAPIAFALFGVLWLLGMPAEANMCLSACFWSLAIGAGAFVLLLVMLGLTILVAIVE